MKIIKQQIKLKHWEVKQKEQKEKYIFFSWIQASKETGFANFFRGI